MNYPMPIINFIVFFLFGCSFFTQAAETTLTNPVFFNKKYPPGTSELYIEQDRLRLLENYGPIEVNFAFSDENNNPVTQVNYSIRCTTYTTPIFRQHGVLESGEWKFEADECRILDIQFYKTGYHGIHRLYVYNRKKRQGTPANPIFEGRTKIYNDKIIMRKVGPIGNIREHTFALTAQADDWSDVGFLGEPDPADSGVIFPEGFKFNLPPKQEPLSTRVDSHIQLTENILDMPSGLHLRLAHSLSPVAAVIHSGTNQIIAPKDKNLILALSCVDPEDGLFLLPSMKQAHLNRPKNVKWILSKMEEAPKEGYVNQIVLDRHYITAVTRDVTYPLRCFYIHLNGLYGKGIIQNARFTDGKITTMIQIYFQHDGSRNTRGL